MCASKPRRPLHTHTLQVVKLNANTLYNLGCRIFWVPSAAAVKGLLKAFESRCKDARKDHFDVKVRWSSSPLKGRL